MAVTYKRIEMIGRLAKNEEIRRYEYDERTSVFINNPGDIQYMVKTLSTKNNIKEELFTGYLNSIKNPEFIDDEYGRPEARVAAFSAFYSKSLFVFSHKIDWMGNSKIDTTEIIPCPSKITQDSRFVAVPCFSGKTDCDFVNKVQLFRNYDSFDQFMHLLKEGRDLGRIYNFQINDNINFPEFVVWMDNQMMCAVGPIKDVSRSGIDTLILQVNSDNIHTINLDDEADDITEYIVQTYNNPTLIHITEEKYLEIINKISQKTMHKVASDEPDVLDESKPINTVSGNLEPVVDDLRELPTEKTESAIFEFFRYHSQKNKLFYSAKDIVNFHTAIKTGNLVILSGMSGTGKSALVDTYAKALGVGKNVLMIPVRPSWNDDSDLLGYVDLIHMVYRPSDTGFINTIVDASENKEKLYLICLDEMNLARVEHYFSQFLSILEKPAGSRELVLYDAQYEGQLYNSSKYPQRVSIGDNVKFIGTVNIDESTYHFSDKVLDRANVITLEVLDYSQPENWKEDKYRAANTPEWSNVDFNKLIKKDDMQIENQSRIREFLWEMHQLLHSVNANLGVGPRIVKSVEMYLRNLPEEGAEFSVSIKDGLDYQVAQRILTKIRGPEEQLKELFNSGDGNNNVLIGLLNKYSDISVFERCKHAVLQKEKELRVYGYCL